MSNDLDGWIIHDSESDGFVFEATKIHVISTMQPQGSAVESFYGNNIEQGLDLLASAKVLVGHNVIKHDIMLYQKLYPGWQPPAVLDTMLLSQLLYPDRLGGHSIEAWGRRMGGEQKVAHEDWSTFSMEMLERCESDTRLNRRVLYRLLKESYEPLTGVDIYNFDFGEHAHDDCQ